MYLVVGRQALPTPIAEHAIGLIAHDPEGLFAIDIGKVCIGILPHTSEVTSEDHGQ